MNISRYLMIFLTRVSSSTLTTANIASMDLAKSFWFMIYSKATKPIRPTAFA